MVHQLLPRPILTTPAPLFPAAGSSIIAKNSIVRAPYPISVSLPSGKDGNVCDSASTGAPAATLFPTATSTVVNSQFVEAPETDGAYPSGGFYNIPSNGAVALTAVEQGKLKWRWYTNWEAVYASGYLGTMALISANLPASMPMGDYLTTGATYVRGPANLAAASCGPGSTINSIISPRYGNAAAGCSASSSYR